MKKSIVVAVLVMATAGWGTALATEYHCQASGDKAGVTKSTYVMTITCMSKDETWQCARPVVGDMECVQSSEKRKVSRTFWDMPASAVPIFCGGCNSGWVQYQGGSTF